MVHCGLLLRMGDRKGGVLLDTGCGDGRREWAWAFVGFGPLFTCTIISGQSLGHGRREWTWASGTWFVDVGYSLSGAEMQLLGLGLCLPA